MGFKEEVLEVLGEVCEEEGVKENGDIEMFEEGVVDSLGSVEVVVGMEKGLG
ncbi:D-alanine--poly(phosphoribitol) ligase subunit 2, partial [Bacillus velezensis]|uniref:D-alanine--poly(phosphoribitol) ligase subunit 2 n=1 Tax=Bacillus velezensis TaxID=492670 RepID=UPI0011A64096